jgi:DnaK suppressor protein
MLKKTPQKEKPKERKKSVQVDQPGDENRQDLPDKRKESLRKVLLAKKEEIWKDVKERLFTQMGKEYREEIDVSFDDGDKAMADLAAETGFSLIDMQTDVLDKIDRALSKLDEGTYGICEDCGIEISDNRLKVVPFAIYCIECKTRLEEMESIAREPERFGPGPGETD